jgi:PPOX class probable F420-dependent enzyme
MSTPSTALQLFEGERSVLLTTYEPDGTPVGSAAAIAVEGHRAYVRTGSRARHTYRLDRRPEAEIAPAKLGGTPLGNPMKARVRRLSGGEARRAARMLARRHPVRQCLAALRPDQARYYELRLIGE